jgi:hypothetical protein
VLLVVFVVCVLFSQVDVVGLHTPRLPLPQLEAIYFITAHNDNVTRIIEDFQDIGNYPYKKVSIYFSSCMCQ